jgi:OFA family oxalate/formate antiporter-like MFS transporter
VARLTGADRRLLLRFWASYGLAVVAGLMALGHAAAIVDAAGGPGGATVAVAGLASASGGVWIALTADRTGTTRLLRYLPLGSALVLGIAAANSNGVIAASAVAAVAFAYGAVIAIYPFAVARTFGGDQYPAAFGGDQYPAAFGGDQYPAAYGRVFTAWGTAGLVGPFGAGLLFEATGTYRIPLLLAAVAAIGSAVTAPRLGVERNRAV